MIRRFLLVAVLIVALAGVASALLWWLMQASGVPTRPIINFLGVGNGSLSTSLDQLHFKDSFAVTEHNLVGVVSFERVSNGTKLRALWFSPDDRTPPLGATMLETQSGAKIARFYLANTVNWRPGPYMLQVFAETATGKEDEPPLTASGKVHFYMGMSEDEVRAYLVEYQTWLDEEERLREEALRVQQTRSASGASISSDGQSSKGVQ